MLNTNIKSKIKELSKIRGNSEIIVYFTSNSRPENLFASNIASDVLPFLGTILEKLGKKKKISLFIFSLGGFLETPWPFVNIIKEYCEEFEVIVPDKAFSAATLICLGADKIIMTPKSLLSPVDPSADLQLSEKIRRNIQVEDIFGFIEFTKEKFGINKEELQIESLKLLSSEIPPSFLGSIYRTQKLISSLTKRLLSLHKDKIKEAELNKIVEKMTRDLFAHNHVINRREAKDDIGLPNIEYANEKEEKLINEIFSLYSDEMKLDREFDVKGYLGDNTSKQYDLVRSIIDSTDITYGFLSKYQINIVDDQFNILNTYNNWQLLNGGTNEH